MMWSVMNNNNETKKTFLQWVDNTWYHYKVPIVLGFVALVIVVTCSVQFLLKKDADVFFYYVGDSSCSVKAIENFRADMADIMTKDYNGDGKKTVDYKEDVFVMYSIDDEQNSGSYVFNQNDQMNIVQRFNMELGVGECVIYIMEPNLYKANKSYIEPLENVLGYVPEFALDEKGIVISDLTAYYKTSLNEFNKDYILCVRRERKNDDKEYYKANADFFKTLVEFE